MTPRTRPKPPPGLPTCPPAQLAAPAGTGQSWLVRPLWPDRACGIIGGEPKTGKSLLALTLAVAAASGQPLLDRFEVTEPGPVLVYPAEDADHIVRNRIRAICHSCRTPFDTIDIRIIRADRLRLDDSHCRRLLSETVRHLRPRLLILDPLTRLHQANENLTCEMAPMLDHLRRLQTIHGCSVMLIHHTRKTGHASHGQTLRGTSDLHAWGDTNLYLDRSHNHTLQLHVEHRATRNPPPLTLRLENQPKDTGPALQIVGDYRHFHTD